MVCVQSSSRKCSNDLIYVSKISFDHIPFDDFDLECMKTINIASQAVDSKRKTGSMQACGNTEWVGISFRIGRKQNKIIED